MKKIVYGLLIFLFIALTLVIYIQERFGNKNKEYVQTILTVNEAFLCKKEKANWIRINEISVNEEIYLCIKFISNTSFVDYALTAYVYGENPRNLNDTIYNETEVVSITDGIFKIHHDFAPGIYDIVLNHSRNQLYELSIEVVD